MKKLAGCMILLLIIFSMATIAGAAANEPVEVPDVKFAVNGGMLELSDVPLNLNGRTMLPLRAVLTALGVPDDDEHIIWNGTEASVTVNHNGGSIYLRCGSNTAYVGDVPVELDAAPFLYKKNSRTYLPVRFVAEAMGKKAAWDGYSRTVYLRDAAEYDRVLAAVEKIEASMEAVEKIKIHSEMVVSIINRDEETGFNVRMTEEQDRKQGILHSEITIPVLDSFVTFTNYYKDNIEYSNSTANEIWKKTEMREADFKQLFYDETSLLSINSREVLAAVLDIEDGTGSDEIVVTGKVYPKGVAENLAVYSGIESLEIEDCNIRITADSNAGHLKNISMDIAGRFDAGGSYSSVKTGIIASYSEINGPFRIVLPDFENTKSANFITKRTMAYGAPMGYN